MATPEERCAMIEQIRNLPAQMTALVQGLSEAELTTHFLEGEWTVAQNVHHVVDSHVNSYIRFKLILAEDHPTLKPYDQETWAEFTDATRVDVEPSLQILRGLHHRWGQVFESLDEAQWARTGFHPEVGDISVEWILGHYAAHGEGHLDQIRRTLEAGRK